MINYKRVWSDGVIVEASEGSAVELLYYFHLTVEDRHFYLFPTPASW